MFNTCHAAVLEAFDQPLALGDLAMPELSPGQVLVEIDYAGVCHSQLNEWHGRRGPDPYLPHTLGHEGSGRVIRTGAGVQKVKEGDEVVITWLRGEGADVSSVQYQWGDRVVNSGAVSTFMTAAVVSENRLVPMTGVPMRIAALLGCAVPTGCGMIFNELRPAEGSSLAVWGIGGVGACAIMAAAVSGCSPLIAVDVRDDKLALARTCGATHTVDARLDPVKEIMDITGNRGVTYSVEAAGCIDTIESAFAVTSTDGGSLVIAGNPPKGATVSLDPYGFIGGKTMRGSWGGAANPDRDVPRFAAMYTKGELPLDALIGREFALADVNLALHALEEGTVGRVLLSNKARSSEKTDA